MEIKSLYPTSHLKRFQHAYAKIISSTNFNEYVQIQFTISLKQKV